MNTLYWRRKIKYWKICLTIMRFDLWCAWQRRRFERARRQIQENYQRVLNAQQRQN